MVKKLLTGVCGFVRAFHASWASGPLELLWGALFKAPAMLDVRTGPNAFAGRTALASGTAFATVSTRQINSDSLVNFAYQVSTVAVNSTAAAFLVVASVVPGVSFALGYSDGTGRGPGGTLMWEIKKSG